jgi:small GTP-binding protein
MVGGSGVGKSCILARFIDNEFDMHHTVTIGVDFETKIIKLKDYEHITVKLQCWDTSGIAIFKSITKSYYKESCVALVVFDLSDYESFLQVDEWVHLVREQNEHNPDIWLVGNKCDVLRRDVTPHEIGRLVHRLGLKYIETSAKTGQGINEVFHNSTSAVYERHKINSVPGIKQCEDNINKKKQNNILRYFCC